MQPLKCGHEEAYRCSHCRSCYQCTHTFVERDNKPAHIIGSWWFTRCPTMVWHRCIGPSKEGVRGH